MNYKYIYPDEIIQYNKLINFIPHDQLYREKYRITPLEEGMYGVYDPGIKFDKNGMFFKFSDKAVILKVKYKIPKEN